MTKTQVSAKPDWFVLSGAEAGDDSHAAGPHLIGTVCEQSGTFHFPPEYTMSRAPGFPDSALREVALSRTGTLWSYTSASYAPPEPYVQVSDPFEPFAIAAVELADEGMVVLGQVSDGVAADELTVGMQMELVAEPLFEDDEAVHMIWKWKPVVGSGVESDQKNRG